MSKTSKAFLDEHNKQLYRYMVLEVSWIITNLSYGPTDLVEQLLFDEVIEQNYNTTIKVPSPALMLVHQAL